MLASNPVLKGRVFRALTGLQPLYVFSGRHVGHPGKLGSFDHLLPLGENP